MEDQSIKRIPIDRLLADRFPASLGIAAQVPAIQITHDQWQRICFVIEEVAYLSTLCAPRSVANSVLQGEAVSHAAECAVELKAELGI